jgi:hypothetical protein
MFLSSHYVDTKLILIKKLNNIYKKSYFYDSLKIKKNISNNQSTNLRKKIFQTSNFLFYEPIDYSFRTSDRMFSSLFDISNILILNMKITSLVQ